MFNRLLKTCFGLKKTILELIKNRGRASMLQCVIERDLF